MYCVNVFVYCSVTSQARAVKGDVLMKERLSMHAKDLDTYVAKEILSNEFRKYVNKHGLSSDIVEVNKRGFLHVLRTFHLPGKSCSHVSIKYLSYIYTYTRDNEDKHIILLHHDRDT